MFQFDHSPNLPTGSDLLAEVGIDPAAVRDAIEDDRAIRCPDRGAVYPERSFTRLVPEPASAQEQHEAAPIEPRDPASPLPSVD
ncbi:MAG: hypothetical protein OXH94_09120 [Rhodospirillales bacterium]|nr:hypothetical protein [Rhodospirillales bacterium]